MYKIVIAEDEDAVRTRIVKHINESETEYEVIGEARDGLQAMELIKAHNPDILMTDICMPRMGGLDLIRSIREIDKELSIIVVSGYDEFSYAREAMSMGVREYLLKPFLPKELFGVLDRTKNIIDQKNQMAVNLQKMSVELQKNLTYSKERFFRRLLEGELGRQEMEVTAADIQFDLQAVWYSAGILGMEAGDQREVNQMTETYFNLIKENYFPETITLHEIQNGSSQMFLFFTSTGRSEERFLHDIRIGMEKICLGMKQYHKISTKCALGRPCNTFEKMSKSFREALDTWRVLFYQDKSVTVYSGNDGMQLQIDEEKAADTTEQLLLDIQMGDKKSAISKIGDIIGFYAELSPDMVEYISISLAKLVLRISDIMEQYGDQEQVWNNQNIISYMKRHFAYGSLSEAKNVLEEYVEKCCDHFIWLNADRSDKIIRKARLLIEESIGDESFNLDKLAENLHFSSNYVRQLFKAKTGENFSDYLFRRRMELAETLLHNPTYKIQDIAEKTGYSNQQYFARCFKKYYNCTPTEYRERQSL